MGADEDAEQGAMEAAPESLEGAAALLCKRCQGCKTASSLWLCGVGPQNFEQLHPWELFVPCRVFMPIISGCSPL